jgi:hypothetical protein
MVLEPVDRMSGMRSREQRSLHPDAQLQRQTRHTQVILTGEHGLTEETLMSAEPTPPALEVREDKQCQPTRGTEEIHPEQLPLPVALRNDEITEDDVQILLRKAEEARASSEPSKAPSNLEQLSPEEQEAQHRREVMRRACSPEERPAMLAELERRYRDAL